MSAIMNWIAWCMAIGTPNWTRSFEYVVAMLERRARDAGRHRRHPGRVRSRVIIAILKPLFSSPMRWPAGTSVSLKVMVAVLEARWPILSSFLSTVTVSSSGTRKQEMPRWPASRSVLA